MNIGFYGHSACVQYPENTVTHFIDLIAGHFKNANIIRHGYVQCSEERILYNVKKTPDLDLCIIFHSYPVYYFIPAPQLKRDAHYTTKQEELDIKFNKYYFEKTNIKREEFIEAIKLYNSYFYDKDLAYNRYYGALIQIDQYLYAKNIPVVHCTTDRTNYPSWFEFKSGIVSMEPNLIKFAPEYFESNHMKSGNQVTEEGNKKIFDLLLPLIDQAFEKTGRSKP
jgi:hypothetical protein